MEAALAGMSPWGSYSKAPLFLGLCTCLLCLLLWQYEWITLKGLFLSPALLPLNSLEASDNLPSGVNGTLAAAPGGSANGSLGYPLVHFDISTHPDAPLFLIALYCNSTQCPHMSPCNFPPSNQSDPRSSGDMKADESMAAAHERGGRAKKASASVEASTKAQERVLSELRTREIAGCQIEYPCRNATAKFKETAVRVKGEGLKDGAGEGGPVCVEKSGSLLTLHDVFVSPRAVVFDPGLHYDRNGSINWYLTPTAPIIYSLNGSQDVLVLERVVNLHHEWGYNFYHMFIEVLPTLYNVLRVLGPNITHYSIYMQKEQQALFLPMALLLFGQPSMGLHSIPYVPGRFLFVHELIQPYISPYERWWPQSFSPELRRWAFLHKDGLPMFGGNWEPRVRRPLSDEEMQRIPEEWVVVLGYRVRGGRVLQETDEVHRILNETFGGSRVVKFSGEGGLMKAKELFNRAVMFVTPHGALCANMVFMPMGAVFFEVIPDGYDNLVYQRLATACGLRHHAVYGKGDKHSVLTLDVMRFKAAFANALPDADAALGNTRFAAVNMTSMMLEWPSRHPLGAPLAA